MGCAVGTDLGWQEGLKHQAGVGDDPEVPETKPRALETSDDHRAHAYVYCKPGPVVRVQGA